MRKKRPVIGCLNVKADDRTGEVVMKHSDWLRVGNMTYAAPLRHGSRWLLPHG